MRSGAWSGRAVMKWSFHSMPNVDNDSLNDEANEKVPRQAANQPHHTGNAIQQDVLSNCCRSNPVIYCRGAEVDQEAERPKRKVQEDGPPGMVGEEINDDRPGGEE